jgi:hypothetical protein
MKQRIPALAIFAILAFLSSTAKSLAAEDGVAVAIVYDTSGSMKDPVRDEKGRMTPKYTIANRALTSVAKQLQAAATRNPSKVIQAGLWVFQGGGAREAVKFGNLDAPAIEKWAAQFSEPGGNTPLGNSVEIAGSRLLKSSLPKKHILVITDGINTAGQPPTATLPKLRQKAAQQQTVVAVHFLAFDVDAKLFDPLKKMGVTVVGAADEKELNTQLNYILQQKILLEDEEPRK